MTKTEVEIKIIENAVQEVASFIYWEVPMEFSFMWKKIRPEIDKAIEEYRNGERWMGNTNLVI